MPRMKNVNVYVDVDLTLVDAQGFPLPDAARAMRELYDAGCHLFLWSTGGGDYCRRVAKRCGITQLFEAFLPKPDIYIDDMPSTIFHNLLFDVNAEPSWPALADKIVSQHVDPRERRA